MAILSARGPATALNHKPCSIQPLRVMWLRRAEVQAARQDAQDALWGEASMETTPGVASRDWAF